MWMVTQTECTCWMLDERLHGMAWHGMGMACMQMMVPALCQLLVMHAWPKTLADTPQQPSRGIITTSRRRHACPCAPVQYSASSPWLPLHHITTSEC